MERAWKDTLVDEYRTKATQYGICNQALFDRALRMCNTKHATINLYKRCIDWCLEAGYPDIDYLRREYADMEDVGLYIDHTFNGELLDKHQVYVFHNCKGRILTALNYDALISPVFYFANGCDMEVDCDQVQPCGKPIRVPLYIFGENTISAKDNANAVYKLYQHELL